ncbi:MAG: nitroreductase, partial [Alphaproteobacteria bacterium]|nr:nitroreductase [Alphaproteobacteria bacterium]
MTDLPQAWKISESDFPRGASDQDKLAFCVRYAVLAPSTYNTQPWHFVIKDKTVLLYADRRYGLPVVDPEDRELTIACGSALFNLRLAIRHFGYSEVTELVPDPNDADLLARVRLGEPREPESADRELFRAIPTRHGNRGAFSERDVPAEILRVLKAEAAAEGAWLHIPGGIERKVLVRMIAEGDHIQSARKSFRREVAGWIHPRRAISGDGLPQDRLSYSDLMNTLGPFAVRRFAVENGRAADDRELEAGSPAIAVLGSKAGGNVERLYTGQALMRLWLRAETEGLSISTLNQPCEVPELRIRLHDEINQHGRAQVILRIGYGGKPDYSSRRPFDQVVDVGGGA